VALSKSKLTEIVTKKVLVDDISDQNLGDFCEYANSQYRSGFPIISDEDYDFIYLKALKKKSS